ncbi:MAG: cation diffusion facilitator family transporter [Gemmatimonadaceae bacterium]
MASESRTAIYVGIAANVLIAATKFAAALVTGSSAMVSEGVHSLVDSGDGLLLLLGQLRGARPADEDHPLGHGKELYFWSLIVAILFFALGGGMSFYEGVQHILRPEAISDPKWNYIVLGASTLFTIWSFTVAFREFHKRAGSRSYWQTFKRSKDPTIFTLVLEDLADLVGLLFAFIGVYFGHRLGKPWLDGAASIGIGLVMTVVAILLLRESKGLLIGEGATRAERAAIHAAACAEPGVRDVRRIITQYYGPDTVLVLMDVAFSPDLDTAGIAAAIDRMEARIRELRPAVKHIYVEAESFKEAARAAP